MQRLLDPWLSGLRKIVENIGGYFMIPIQTFFIFRKTLSQTIPIRNETIEKLMIAKMIKLMKETDAPPEQYERIGLFLKNHLVWINLLYKLI